MFTLFFSSLLFYLYSNTNGSFYSISFHAISFLFISFHSIPFHCFPFLFIPFHPISFGFIPFPLRSPQVRPSDSSSGSEATQKGSVEVQVDDRESLQLQEERRVLYVGMTRARSRLFLCYRQKNVVGKRHIPLEPSRFLVDLPEGVSWVRATGK